MDAAQKNDEERTRGHMYTCILGGFYMYPLQFSGYIKLAYCSSAKGAPVAQLVRASD